MREREKEISGPGNETMHNSTQPPHTHKHARTHFFGAHSGAQAKGRHGRRLGRFAVADEPHGPRPSVGAHSVGHGAALPQKLVPVPHLAEVEGDRKTRYDSIRFGVMTKIWWVY